MALQPLDPLLEKLSELGSAVLEKLSERQRWLVKSKALYRNIPNFDLWILFWLPVQTQSDSNSWNSWKLCFSWLLSSHPMVDTYRHSEPDNSEQGGWNLRHGIEWNGVFTVALRYIYLLHFAFAVHFAVHLRFCSSTTLLQLAFAVGFYSWLLQLAYAVGFWQFNMILQH